MWHEKSIDLSPSRGHHASHVSPLPWFQRPLTLISWWDMNEFSAERFVSIIALLRGILASQQDDISSKVEDDLLFLGKECGALGLGQSSAQALQLAFDVGPSFRLKAPHPIKLETALDILLKTVQGEMQSQLFFSIPSNRVEYYGKNALQILGQLSCERFPSAAREVEEGSKCFAFGRYTACAFHFARATEAGVQGLARAIKFTPKDGNWNGVWQAMGNQTHDMNGKKITDSKQLPHHWQSHASFLDGAKALLQAVAKVWRNNIAHLVDVYTEDDAKEIMTVIPIFLRDLSKQMDEDGNLY